MVEIFGKVESSEIENGNEKMDFIIPAFSRRIARRRARTNARIKTISDPEVTSLEVIRSGDLPGQSIFLVGVEG